MTVLVYKVFIGLSAGVLNDSKLLLAKNFDDVSRKAEKYATENDCDVIKIKLIGPVDK